MTRALHHAIYTDQLGPSADESRAETERSAFSAVAIRWDGDALYVVDVSGADQSANQLAPAKLGRCANRLAPAKLGRCANRLALPGAATSSGGLSDGHRPSQ